MVDLHAFVSDFAECIQAADSRRPQASSHSGRRTYQPGLGPHSEDAAVRLVVGEMQLMYPERYGTLRTHVPYPGSRQKCDLALGAGPGWAIEVKVARLSGDNGKPDDTAVKDILSPYDVDRSAVWDCTKLATAGFPGRAAVLIYGFEDSRRPLDVIIDAFEVLASTRVRLGPRCVAGAPNLIHPVFRAARVFAWEVKSLRH